jgi:hypothetical protein
VKAPDTGRAACRFGGIRLFRDRSGALPRRPVTFYRSSARFHAVLVSGTLHRRPFVTGGLPPTLPSFPVLIPCDSSFPPFSSAFPSSSWPMPCPGSPPGSPAPDSCPTPRLPARPFSPVSPLRLHVSFSLSLSENQRWRRVTF